MSDPNLQAADRQDSYPRGFRYIEEAYPCPLPYVVCEASPTLLEVLVRIPSGRVTTDEEWESVITALRILQHEFPGEFWVG